MGHAHRPSEVCPLSCLHRRVRGRAEEAHVEVAEPEHVGPFHDQDVGAGERERLGDEAVPRVIDQRRHHVAPGTEGGHVLGDEIELHLLRPDVGVDGAPSTVRQIGSPGGSGLDGAIGGR